MMKNLIIHQLRPSLICFFLTIFLWAFFSAASTQASEVNISASIPDIIPPSVPILIEPSDGSIISDNTPTFRWYESTDNLAMSHYNFYRNGSVLFANVPLTATNNSQYLLEYDSLNGIYSLTPKSSFNDGAHTWRVVAVDFANLSASSDTWDFTVDTLVPSFVLSKIGDTSVNISAANPSSVPDDPILIFQDDADANEPILIASGEANSDVKLTVTIPDDPNQVFNTSINSSGQYELQLGILPRDEDICMDFIITDQVGHVSVLEDVCFRIALQYWPTATSTVSPTDNADPSSSPTSSTTSSPTPTSSITRRPSISTTLSPTSSVSSSLTPSVTASPSALPTGIIPIIPPREIIHELVDEAIEILPESTSNKVREFLISSLWKKLSTWFGSFLLLLLYASSFILLSSKFISSFSGVILKRILMLLFPPVFESWQNLVFDYRDTLASPLVKVELLDENKQVLETTITDINGNFNDLSYPINQNWMLRVEDKNFYFPIGDQKPKQLQTWQFYQGQVFDQKSYSGQAILIPTLRAAGQESLPFMERVRIFFLYLLDYPLWFLVLVTFIALVFALRYPSLYNYLALGFYLIIGAIKLVKWIKSKSQLVLVARLNKGDRQFSDNLIVSLLNLESRLKKSMVVPFDFAKSKPIKHDFESANICVFAKNLALESKDQLIGEQQIRFNGSNQEIELWINQN